MGVLTIREFEADVVTAMARVTAGETLDITRDGHVVAEIRPKRMDKLNDPEFRAAYERLMDSLMTPIAGLHAPVSYEDRTGR